MKKLTVNKIDLGYIPEHWQELTADQVKALCQYCLFALSTDSLKIMLLLYITRLRLVNAREIPAAGGLFDKTLFPIKGKKTGIFYAATADIALLASSLSFIFPDRENNSIIYSRLVTNHFPKLKTRRFQTLYGPSDGLYTLSFAEFIRLETLYDRLDKSPGALDRFCGVLYRRKNPHVNPDDSEFSGDMRIPYNDHHLEKYARQAARLHPWMKIYIKLLYEGCRNFIIEKHPGAFSTMEETEPGHTTFEHFNQLVIRLANNDVTKANHIRSAPLYDVMGQLEAFAQEAKALRESMDKKPVY